MTIEKTASNALCEADGPCEVTPQKLVGVALLGALGSLAIYYIYSSLSEETRQALKDNVTSAVKSNLAKLAQQ